MYTAIDENKNKVSITDAKRQGLYFCPVCGEPLSVRAEYSQKRKKHFAHKPGTLCRDDWNYDMSEWHKAWQEQFPIECREVVMESEGEKHRADVSIHNVIIEFQHSPITYEDFTKRNRFYLKCGYEILWIFDAENIIEDSTEKIVKPEYGKDINDYFERAFKWKKIQNQFANFNESYPQGSRIAVYLETKMEGFEDKVLIPLKTVDALNPKAYVMYPYITTKNFLKEYRCIDDPQVLSVSDIIKKTTQVQQQQISQQLKPQPQNYYIDKPRPRRRGWL